MPTAVRTNAQPVGGTTDQQPVAPMATPAQIADLIQQMTPTVTKFREQSTRSSVKMATQAYNLGDNLPIKVPNVGLGVRTISRHSTVITLVNANGGAAQVVNISPLFPYNILANTAIGINGGAAVYSCGGVNGLFVAARNRPSTFLLNTLGGFGPALSPALVSITIGANVTPTNTAANVASFSGIASVSVAAGSTGTITVVWYTFEKLCLDRESLIGILPLQNNNTYVELTRKYVGNLVGSGANGNPVNRQFNPMFTAGAVPGTLTFSAVDTVTTLYEFQSAPYDTGLYQEMVQNSYQVQEQPAVGLPNVGSESFSYDIPTNQYAIALHMLASDNNGNLLPSDDGGFPLIKLVYNAGSIKPLIKLGGIDRAAQFLDYEDDRQMFGGYRLWDGTNTTEDLADADQMGWLDTYNAASPQIVADVVPTIATPGRVAIAREQVVAGAVQVVGGGG